MRPVPIKVSVPQPCSQSWDSMSPEGAGRFCGSCNKVVVDFTRLSDNQIVEILSDTSRKYCGHFNTTQLDRIMVAEKPATYLLPAMVITALLVAGGSVTVVSAATNIPVTDTANYITGVVADKSGNPLQGATIMFKGTRTGVLADYFGNYKLAIPPELKGKDLTLVFAFIGFKTVEMPVTANYEEGQPVKVQLNDQDNRLTGELVIVHKLTRWQKVKRTWKRLWNHR